MPIVYPGMEYLLSFYAVSNTPGDQLYWHRYLITGSSHSWGPTGIGSNPERVVFRCAGTANRTLDCGDDPTVPLGLGIGSDRFYWLFLGDNNEFGDPLAPGFRQSGPADLYVGGFQIEPTNTEKRGVVAMGDSLTQYDCTAVDPAGCSSWTVVASSLLNVPVYNRGAGGQRCDQILARWPTDASSILDANAEYAIIACGTNDISQGRTLVQIEQSISAMADLSKADGAIPVIATIGPFAFSLSNDGAEATRNSINAWIRATYPRVLDFDSVYADPANPRRQNPAYADDGTHLNLAGRIAEGTYVARSVAGNALGYPDIWNFNEPIPYQAVLAQSPSNGMDFKAGAQREVGSYIILPSAGTLNSNNYQFSFRSNVLSVTPAPLSVSGNDKSINFGDPIPNLDGTISGTLPRTGFQRSSQPRPPLPAHQASSQLPRHWSIRNTGFQTTAFRKRAGLSPFSQSTPRHQGLASRLAPITTHRQFRLLTAHPAPSSTTPPTEVCRRSIQTHMSALFRCHPPRLSRL